MKKNIFKRILTTMVISCTFCINSYASYQFAVPATNLEKTFPEITATNYIEGKTSGNEEMAIIEPIAENVMYSDGNIGIRNLKKEILINGLGPDHCYYDENGIRQSSLNMIGEKYYKIMQEIPDSEEIIFDSELEFEIFTNWYQNNFATQQGKLITWRRDGIKRIAVKKKSYTKMYSYLSEDYWDAINNLVSQIPENISVREKAKLTQELVAKFMAYDYDAMEVDLDTAVKNRKGLCYHYAKIVHDVLNKLGIKNQFEFGRFFTSNPDEYHIWNSYYDHETGYSGFIDASQASFDVSFFEEQQANPLFYLYFYKMIELKEF